MTLTPGNYDITLYQGATFAQTLTWKNSEGSAINLTGFSARMMAREHLDAEAFLTLTTENGGITLGGVAGTIALAVTATDTAALTASRGVYDMELVDGAGKVQRLLQGNIYISREVTR